MKTVHFVYGLTALNNFVAPKDSFWIKDNVFFYVDGEGKSESYKENIDFGMPLKIHRFKDIYTVLISVAKYIKLKKPDVVVSHMSRFSLIPLMLSMLAGVKHRIYFCHGAPYKGYSGVSRLIMLIYELLVIFSASRVITVNPTLSDDLKKYFSKKEIISLYPGSCAGIPCSFFCDESLLHTKINDLKNNCNPIKIGFVGRPYKRKGFHDLLSACEILKKNSIEFELYVCGFSFEEMDGFLKERVNAIGDKVKILGFLTDMKPFYDSVNIVALPSYHEGFGYALLEGACRANALISYCVDGPRTIIVPNYNGFLLPVGDVNAIFRKLVGYHRNREMLAKHSSNSVAYSYNFQRSVIGSQLEDLYNKF